MTREPVAEVDAWIPYLAIAMRQSSGHERWHWVACELDEFLSLACVCEPAHVTSAAERIALVTMKLRRLRKRVWLLDVIQAWHRLFATLAVSGSEARRAVLLDDLEAEGDRQRELAVKG